MVTLEKWKRFIQYWMAEIYRLSSHTIGRRVMFSQVQVIFEIAGFEPRGSFTDICAAADYQVSRSVATRSGRFGARRVSSKDASAGRGIRLPESRRRANCGQRCSSRSRGLLGLWCPVPSPCLCRNTGEQREQLVLREGLFLIKNADESRSIQNAHRYQHAIQEGFSNIG